MSASASHASAFYRDVAGHQRVWTIRDKDGFPAPIGSSGRRAHPFWSTLERVRKIIDSVPAYRGFEPFELSWTDFRDRWLPGIDKDGLLVGINWSGARASGYDAEPADVLKSVEEAIARRDAS